jgi:hypothetical protein
MASDGTAIAVSNPARTCERFTKTPVRTPIEASSHRRAVLHGPDINRLLEAFRSLGILSLYGQNGNSLRIFEYNSLSSLKVALVRTGLSPGATPPVLALSGKMIHVSM